MASRNAANNPVLDHQSLWMMIEDMHDLTADAGQECLAP